MITLINDVQYGYVRKNKYGWDINDDDFWGTGYSDDINHAWLYEENGIYVKRTITTHRWEEHKIITHQTKSGKWSARCIHCGRTHRGKPKALKEDAIKSVSAVPCSCISIKTEIL